MKALKTTLRRKKRVRASIAKKAEGRTRLSVFRSEKHIYVQLIDDGKGQTLASASTVEKEFKGKKAGSNCAAAEAVGKLIAERARKAGITEVVFDRGAYLYHGRVKALAEAARSGGLNF
jgi:large subunit ribosomal protein L18